MKTAIVWFKTDLRLYDNEALIKAIEQEQILPIYCFDDSHFETTQYGLKLAAIELSFLLESLIDLDASFA
jgi:deoxyribodipyrimidine photo-lyase